MGRLQVSTISTTLDRHDEPSETLCAAKRDPRGAQSPMECQKTKNMKNCNCSYPGCDNKGICCQCLSYHLSSKQLPACCFPNDVERTYDRSFKAFAKAWKLS
jgi:hypothetical protein